VFQIVLSLPILLMEFAKNVTILTAFLAILRANAKSASQEQTVYSHA